jgi:hypothetical protein
MFVAEGKEDNDDEQKLRRVNYIVVCCRWSCGNQASSSRRSLGESSAEPPDLPVFGALSPDARELHIVYF